MTTLTTTKPVAAKTIERRRYVLPPGVEPAPDVDDDMPDPMYQHKNFFDIVEVLRAYLEDERTMVDGDFPLYYRNRDGVQTHVKPDCGVAFGVNTDYIYERNGYFIEEMEKSLDFVLEIASTTTAHRDIGFKRDLYEWLKVREYFGFDKSGGKHYRVPLFGWRLRGDKYVPVETTRRDDGSTWAYSEQLGLYICADGEDLRAWSPARGEFLRTTYELVRELRESQRELRESERVRARLEAELRALREGGR